MPLIPWLTRAGSFDVEHVGGIPHFNESVTLGAPRAGVLHTTEGATIEGAMSVFRSHYAPHFVVGRDAIAHDRFQVVGRVGHHAVHVDEPFGQHVIVLNGLRRHAASLQHGVRVVPSFD